MPQRVTDAKIDFYNPATGALRYSLTSGLRSIRISETATDQADTAGFDLKHDYADLSNFKVGDECRVFIRLDTDPALVHIWTGVLDSLHSARDGPSFARLPLQAQDFVYWILAHSFVTESYSNMKAGAIVRDIVSKAAPSINTTNVEDTGTTVPSIVFNGESLLSAIRRLAQFAGATFKGDKDKKLHFFEKATKASGRSVDAGAVVRGSFEVETSFSDIGNVVTVIGGRKKVQDSTSSSTTFNQWSTVTGIVRQKARVFFSKSRVARVDIWTNPSSPSALTGGLTVRLQADNAAGTAPVAEADANFDLASVTLTSSQLSAGDWTAFDLPEHIAPPGAYVWVIVESDANSQRVGLDSGANLIWRSYFDLPIVVQKSDLASIDTYGKRELQPVTNSEIRTEEEADALASRVLSEHKDPTQTGRYEVEDSLVDVDSAIVGRWKLDEAAGTDGANLVANPGFETYTTTPGAPDSWTLGAGVAANVAKETTVKRSGSNAVRLERQATDVNIYQEFTTLSGGKSYYVEAWGRTGGGSAYGQLEIRNVTDGVNIAAINLTTGGTTFEKLSRSFKAIAGKTYRLTLYVVGPDGSFAYWDDISVQEIQAKDAAASGHGTLSGAANTAGPTIGAAGQVGTAYSFDGVDDYVSIPDAAAYSIVTTMAMSWEFWVKRGDLDQGTIMGKAENPYEWAVSINPTSHKIALSVWSSGGGSIAGVESAGAISDTTTFHHVAVTVEMTTTKAGTAKIYIDGVLDSSTPFSHATNEISDTASQVFIGQRGDGSGTGFFNGTIDEPRIYSRALTAGEVAWLYKEGLAARSSSKSLATAPVGQTVSASFPKDGIANGTALIVTRRMHDYEAERGTYSLHHEFSSVQTNVFLNDILRAFQDRIKRLEDKASVAPVLYLVASVHDGAKVADSVSAVENPPDAPIVDSGTVDVAVVW